MESVTAIAHPNIALVKYWGKRDVAQNLPAVPSLSLTLGGWRTRTTVIWGADRDCVELDGQEVDDPKITAFLGLLGSDRPPVSVVSDNDFPTGAGLASSASGFAALALAATRAAGLTLSDAELSALARRGSGSASRSIFGGFVQWDDTHAQPIAAPPWDVRMVVAVVNADRKDVGSTAGMARSRATSPYWDAWVHSAAADVAEARAAVLAQDLERLGTVMESSTFKMHATMHTAVPPLLYWQPATVAVLHAVFALRAAGVGAWATMDAGPQVKVLCSPSDADAVRDALAPHALAVHIHGPGGGARVVPT